MHSAYFVFFKLGHQGLFGSSCVKHRAGRWRVVLSGVSPPEFSQDCCMAGSFVCGQTHTSTSWPKQQLLHHKPDPTQCCFLGSFFGNSFMWSLRASDEHADASRRRRERRLTQFLRHERLNVAMVLSEKKHHTSRSQRTDRTEEQGPGSRGSRRTATVEFRETPLPSRSSSSCTKKRRGAAAFAEPRPLRDTMEQLADFAPKVQILDEPQTVEQLVFKHIDISVPEQVIEVPKILCPARPSRAVLADAQMGEQLVEVPVPSPRDCVITATLREVVLARFWDAAGCEWCQYAGQRELCWWLSGTRHTQSTPPQKTHRQPRAVYKHWARLRRLRFWFWRSL